MMMQEHWENGEKERLVKFSAIRMFFIMVTSIDKKNNGDIALMPATCLGKAHFGSRQQEMKLFQV